MLRRIPLNLETLEEKTLLSGLSATVTTNQSTYQAGQSVVMTFQETNVSSQPINVEEGPSVDGFDVTQGGKVIWRSNSGAEPMFIMLDTLQPGQSLTLTATWNGVPTNGSSPVTGTFDVSNQLDLEATAKVTISSQPASAPSATTSPNGDPQPIVVTTPTAPVSQGPGTAPTTPAGPTSPTSPTSPTAPTTPTTPTDPAPTTSGTVSDPTPVSVTVATDHPTYRKGHDVRITMTLKNTGDQAVTLPKGTTAEFTLYDGSTPVWQGARVLHSTRSDLLKSGHSVKVSTDWSGKADSSSVPLAAGSYTLVATATGESTSTTFQLAG